MTIRILLVDDDPAITIRTSMALRSAGYEVSIATCGEEALDHLVSEEHTPSLILLDLVMPSMDGWRFREIQRHHSKLWHIPVVVLADAPINEEYGASLQMAGALLKPFDRAELLKTVALVLKTHEPARVIKTGDRFTSQSLN